VSLRRPGSGHIGLLPGLENVVWKQRDKIRKCRGECLYVRWGLPRKAASHPSVPEAAVRAKRSKGQERVQSGRSCDDTLIVGSGRCVVQERCLGEEWGIWVSKSSREFTLHMPVESGVVGFQFDFPCSESDLRVLESSRFRRKTLEFILHEHLQRTTIRGGPKRETDQILRIIKSVLHGSPEDIEQEIRAAPKPSYIRWLTAQAGLRLET
jgi:hypothetical protein